MVWTNSNDIKAVQTGGGFIVLYMLSLPIVYTTIFLAGDTRQDLDVTISYAGIIQSPSLNEISMIMSNSKAKEEIFGLTLRCPESKTF